MYRISILFLMVLAIPLTSQASSFVTQDRDLLEDYVYEFLSAPSYENYLLRSEIVIPFAASPMDLLYPQTDQFKLSETSLNDLKEFKTLFEETTMLNVIVFGAAYEKLWINITKLGIEDIAESIYTYTTNDWDGLSKELITLSALRRIILVKQLRWILYKHLVRHSPPADIKFWKSLLNAIAMGPDQGIIGTYAGKVEGDIPVNVTLKVWVNNNQLWGTMHLTVAGRANTFEIDNIKIERNRIYFNHFNYGKNQFIGDINKDFTEIKDLASFFGQRIIWRVDLQRQ